MRTVLAIQFVLAIVFCHYLRMHALGNNGASYRVTRSVRRDAAEEAPE